MKVVVNPVCNNRMRFHAKHSGCHCSCSIPKATIWSLPEEMKLQLLIGLHVTDLLSMRSTHSSFRDLIDDHVSVVWSSVSFEDEWPTLPNMAHFSRAAEYGNMEALVKLGIAYLYNEGLPGDFQGKKITCNGEKAAEMFCKVETLMSHTTPFTWLFIRPPWATTGACCKECVFNNMKTYSTQKVNDTSVVVCVAQTLLMLEDEACKAEAIDYLQKAAVRGSPHAAFLLWQHNHIVSDVATELQSIRKLRDIASRENLASVLHLCRFYAQGKYGGICQQQAAAFVREFFQSSKPTHVEEIYKNTQLTDSMRYILVDWLVEVAGMKIFGSPTLHAAISVVDRYLRFHRTTRARFQLLGVAAMVLCSRFLGKDIITIREAAWLTDNTYKYEDVVRMMGEIIATLRGNIRVCCTLDYIELLGLMVSNDRKTQCLAEYICELSLLQSVFGSYPQAQVSASAILLARLTQKKEFPWPSHMLEFTGFDVGGLSKCTLHLLNKCFLQGAMVDHRAVILQAVKQRYAEDCFCQVSNIKMPSAADIAELLGIQEAVAPSGDVKLLMKTTPALIMSPSRNKSGQAQRQCEMTAEREKAATPTLDAMESSFDLSFNTSVFSGYDGDQEDESESFGLIEYDEESDIEQDSVPMPSACHCSSSGMYGSDSSFSSSPAPYSVRQSLRPTKGTSICINIPVFGSLTSSPLVTCHNSRSVSLGQQISPITSGQNVHYSPFTFGADSRSFTIQPDPDSVCVSKMESVSLDSGIEVPTQNLESPSVNKATELTNPGLASSTSNASRALKPISNSVLNRQQRAQGGKETRKRRNSVQLGNENKTHVVSK